jgi:hypothetical protein
VPKVAVFVHNLRNPPVAFNHPWRTYNTVSGAMSIVVGLTV